MLPYQKTLIDAELEKRGLEHLKCIKLYTRSYDVVMNVLNLKYWQEEKYRHLLTAKALERNAEDIIEILNLPCWNDERYAHLLTPSIWFRKAFEITEILQFPYWSNEKFKHLLSPSIWFYKSSKIKAILDLPYWNDERYVHLLKSEIFRFDPIALTETMDAYISLGLSTELNCSNLYNSKDSILTAARHLKDNLQPLVIGGKLHPYFQKSRQASNTKRTKRENRALIDEMLQKKALLYLKSPTIYSLTYEEVIDILDLPYWNDARYKHLLTAGIWQRSKEEIETIINMKCWEEERFSGLFWPNIWKAAPSDIEDFLALPYWNVPNFQKLLTPAIWAFSKEKIVTAIETYRSLRLDNYIQVSSLRRSRNEIIALYKYMRENQIPLILKGKIHFYFNLTNDELLKRYGISLDSLVEMYKEEQRRRRKPEE